ncbi:MAG TPA: TIGR02391 family protein [Cyclobacteriaceae bacterium]|nr:TIGR02391 family protein [Cyclobacteriaceae bacterium]
MMKDRFNIVVRSKSHNNGKNKYATVINDETVDHFANAINSNTKSVLINGIRLHTRTPDYVKIFKLKVDWAGKTDNEVKNILREEAREFFNGKLNVRILAKHGEDVTSGYIKPGIVAVSDKHWPLIHPAIKDVSMEKFLDGYFSDAVLSAFKEINDKVKKEYHNVVGKEEDGTSLMRKAFAHQSPVFRLTDLSSESNKNIQQGYMDIFAGVMMAIRNPIAHANIEVNEVDAWEKLCLQVT